MKFAKMSSNASSILGLLTSLKRRASVVGGFVVVVCSSGNKKIVVDVFGNVDNDVDDAVVENVEDFLVNVVVILSPVVLDCVVDRVVDKVVSENLLLSYVDVDLLEVDQSVGNVYPLLLFVVVPKFSASQVILCFGIGFGVESTLLFTNLWSGSLTLFTKTRKPLSVVELSLIKMRVRLKGNVTQP